MFSPNSRYANAGTYTIRTANGTEVTVTRLPVRPDPAVRAFHPREDGHRPDQIAAHYLADPTAFWLLCDAGDAVAPDALAAREMIAIPPKER
jgi:hypothetical protein